MLSSASSFSLSLLSKTPPSFLPNPKPYHSLHLKTLKPSSPQHLLTSFSPPLPLHCHCSPKISFSTIPNPKPNIGFALRAFSSYREVEEEDPTSFSEASDGCQDHLRVVREEKQTRFIPVKAYFPCTYIDLKGLVAQNQYNFIQPNSRASATNYVVLRYSEVDSLGLESSLGIGNNCCCMVVFHYGSVVLFNVNDHEVEGYLKIVLKHASGLLSEMRKDDYAVVEKPTLETWMQGGLDYIMLKNLNIDGIRTIGSVLGQSIALDYYIRQVDGMVAEFTDINRGMEENGNFTMKRKKLFQLVGKANSNLADVILKLGFFDRSDIAWKNANYAQIWEYLRDEYELTQRFASLDFKLKFVEHNIRFLQEILQNRKSDFLEWLIIILIGVEILISVYNIVRESAITSL
ncbi:hypothetical protein MRB53_029438 [Persea americana]|uniref:Uncharacterized protein n=1 Tax=Persea americana TaxID=3435 RepID=A0ACC2KIX8_PERAE|nr:hypothetical protein MRB53_029438 [Persea americana]